MKRQLYSELLKWKDSSGRKPLIIRGARQVGKTYLLEEFGQNEFNSFVRLNFEKQPSLASIFQKDLSIKRIVQEIEVELNTTIDPSNTLIVFDEVQLCPQALTSLKYFCEEGKEYFIASAGSLLGLKIGESSFPVGNAHFLDLFPMSFHEFLMGIGEEKLAQFLAGLEKIEPLSENIHQKFMDNVRLYFCVGGMPEAVKAYSEKQDLKAVREIQMDMLDTYSNDFAKHAGNISALKIDQIFNSVPKQLLKEHKKFMFADVKKGARAKDFEEAINWLVSAKLVHKISMISRPELPLSHFVDENVFKLMLLDVGLLGALSGTPTRALFQDSEMFKTFKGAFAESFVGQELLAGGARNLYYWRSEHEAEIDYLVVQGENIYPIEVKSGESGKLKSLLVYSKAFAPKFRIRASAKNLFRKDDFVNLPLYGIGLMNLL